MSEGPITRERQAVVITEADRLQAVANVRRAENEWQLELSLVDMLARHRVVAQDNLGYYRTVVHCSCANEWWCGGRVADYAADLDLGDVA